MEYAQQLIGKKCRVYLGGYGQRIVEGQVVSVSNDGWLAMNHANQVGLFGKCDKQYFIALSEVQQIEMI